MYEGPGVYRHYKGGLYHVLGIAVREETVNKTDQTGTSPGGDRVVVYIPLSKGSLLENPLFSSVTMWTRPLHDFNAMLTELPDLQSVDNSWFPRFKKVE